MKTTFVENTTNVEMYLTILLPKKNGKGADFDIDKSRFDRQQKVINAFSPRIIESLKRRMQACQQLLISHINDIEYNDGKHIRWQRKDGSFGYFSIPSFGAMQSALQTLEKSDKLTRAEVDQILKALLNDTEQISHEDAKGYKWSELISILCESHVE